MKKLRPSKKALEHLSKVDHKLGELIEHFHIISRDTMPDIFKALCNCMVSQQISGNAAESILKKLDSNGIIFEPKMIINADAQLMHECGLSQKKVGWIKSAALKFGKEEIDQSALSKMTDADAIAALTKLDGVGVWTAEMLLIFSMKRQNIFSFGDYGIRCGLKKIHPRSKIDKKTFEKYRKLYSPYCTTASIYLWAIANEK